MHRKACRRYQRTIRRFNHPVKLGAIIRHLLEIAIFFGAVNRAPKSLIEQFRHFLLVVLINAHRTRHITLWQSDIGHRLRHITPTHRFKSTCTSITSRF
jgi:hypothetical protein